RRTATDLGQRAQHGHAHLLRILDARLIAQPAFDELGIFGNPADDLVAECQPGTVDRPQVGLESKYLRLATRRRGRLERNWSLDDDRGRLRLHRASVLGCRLTDNPADSCLPSAVRPFGDNEDALEPV